MSGLFSKPSLSAPAATPQAPSVANSQPEMDIAARQQALALQRGRASTVLTGGAGLSNMGTTSRVLLGSS